MDASAIDGSGPLDEEGGHCYKVLVSGVRAYNGRQSIIQVIPSRKLARATVTECLTPN